MQYYVIALDGQRYGPVDVATLSQWAVDNRVTPTTTLEGPDGVRVAASSVAGIVFPLNASGGQPGPGVGSAGVPPMGAPPMGMPMGGPMGGPTAGPGGYSAYPHGGGMAMDGGQKDITISWIFSALTLFVGWACCPLLFGIIAIVYGNNAKKKGHPQGQTALIVAIVVTVLAVVVAGGIRAMTMLGSSGRIR